MIVSENSQTTETPKVIMQWGDRKKKPEPKNKRRSGVNLHPNIGSCFKQVIRTKHKLLSPKPDLENENYV